MFFLKYYLNVLKNKMFVITRRKPIIVILGATGTGKSKLAIEIALKYNGEVISADSMQVYKGLDIVTNKVTHEERASVPHHMLDFLESSKEYTVADFRNATLPIIDRLHAQKKLPVVVGGTHYYLESLLWNVLVQSEVQEGHVIYGQNKDAMKRYGFVKEFVRKSVVPSEVREKGAESEMNGKCNSNSDGLARSNSDQVVKSDTKSVVTNDDDFDLRKKLDILPTMKLYELLEEIDPEMAAIYHPNNERKIRRSIEVWVQTGDRHSALLRRQREAVGITDLGGEVRFPNSIVIWITCDKSELDERLDKRVDDMLATGLLTELDAFQAKVNAPLLQKKGIKVSEGVSNDIKLSSSFPSLPPKHYTKGILQSIGFKEFHDFLLLNDEQKESPKGKKLYSKSVELMKQRTNRYSRNQVKWIRNRFLRRNRMRIPVYTVDSTDPSRWFEDVSAVADDVLRSCLAGKTPTKKPVELVESELTELDRNGDKTRHVCSVCDRVLIGDLQWKHHLEGIKHRKQLKRKREELQAKQTLANEPNEENREIDEK